MKKTVFILFILVAINISAPASETLYQRQRHLIENTAGVNKKDVPADELLKQKVVLFARQENLMVRILIIDRCSARYNNSS